MALINNKLGNTQPLEHFLKQHFDDMLSKRCLDLLNGLLRGGQIEKVDDHRETTNGKGKKVKIISASVIRKSRWVRVALAPNGHQVKLVIPRRVDFAISPVDIEIGGGLSIEFGLTGREEDSYANKPYEEVKTVKGKLFCVPYEYVSRSSWWFLSLMPLNDSVSLVSLPPLFKYKRPIQLTWPLPGLSDYRVKDLNFKALCEI